MEQTFLEIFSSYIGIISGLAAAGGLIFTGFTFHRDNLTRQGQVASDLVRDLKSLDQRLVDIKTEERKISHEEYNMKFNTWKSIFFNEMEWIAFLISTNRINDKQIISFFKPMFMTIVEKRFYQGDLISDEDRKNPKKYLYIKQLYDKIKDP